MTIFLCVLAYFSIGIVFTAVWHHRAPEHFCGIDSPEPEFVIFSVFLWPPAAVLLGFYHSVVGLSNLLEKYRRRYDEVC